MYLDIYYGLTVLLFFAALVLAAILLKRYVAFYLNFPNGSLLFIVIKWIVMSRIKRNPEGTKTILEVLHEVCSKLHKDGLCVLWMYRPFIFVCNEKTMKAFSNEQCSIGKIPEYKLIKECFGVSLITADADVWKIRKKMLNAAFKTPVLKHHVPMINESATALVNKLMTLPNDTPVHLVRIVQSCAFANIYEFLSGNNPNDPERKAEVEDVIDIINMLGNTVTYRVFRPWLYPRSIMKFFAKGREYMENLNIAHGFSKKILFEMKDSVSSKKEKDLEKDGFYDAPKCFAQVLVQQHMKNPSFSFKDMHDEMNGLFSAGFDTVSHTLMWAMFLLGHHHEIQEKLFTELDGFMDNDLTFDDLQHLPYLDSVVKETLRLYPAVPLYGKRLEKEVQYEKYTFAKGTNLVFAPYVIHRDPTYYSDPEKFYPERFLETAEKKITTYAFAEGARSCIGKQFALIEVKIVLAHIIKNFKVTSLDRKEDVRLHWEIILTTTKPIYFKISSRLKKQIA